MERAPPPRPPHCSQAGTHHCTTTKGGVYKEFRRHRPRFRNKRFKMGTDDLYPNTLHYVMVFMNLYNGHVEFAEQAPVDPPTIITS